MTEGRTQAERTAQARRRLVRATIRLLAEHGYTGTTLAEIGKEAGLSRSLVTHHFGSKDACIIAAIHEIRDAATGALRLEDEGNVRGLARIEHLIEAYIGSTSSGQRYIRALYVVMADAISQAPGLRDAVAEANELFRAQIRVWLRQAADDGEIPADTDVHAHAVLIEGLLRGICLQWFADPTHVDLAASITAAQRMVRAGFADTGAATRPAARR